MGAAPPDGLGPAAVRSCGGCGVCCQVLDLPEINKPGGGICPHQTPGAGCSIHATRPASCRTFECFWVSNTILGEDWRPDRCGFMLWSKTEDQLIVDVDPARPDAWRQEPYFSRLRALAAPDRPGGQTVLIRIWPRTLMLFPEGEIELGEQQAGKSIAFGYTLGFDGRRIPYARYVDPPPSAN